MSVIDWSNLWQVSVGSFATTANGKLPFRKPPQADRWSYERSAASIPGKLLLRICGHRSHVRPRAWRPGRAGCREGWGRQKATPGPLFRSAALCAP